MYNLKILFISFVGLVSTSVDARRNPFVSMIKTSKKHRQQEILFERKMINNITYACDITDLKIIRSMTLYPSTYTINNTCVNKYYNTYYVHNNMYSYNNNCNNEIQKFRDYIQKKTDNNVKSLLYTIGTLLIFVWIVLIITHKRK